jgi:hypothetical protein
MSLVSNIEMVTLSIKNKCHFLQQFSVENFQMVRKYSRNFLLDIRNSNPKFINESRISGICF